MDSNKYSKLVKNTAIFAIGNFSTKILTFLIVPLYTYVLSTEEYGRIDLFLTTVNFLIPILTLSGQEALVRYIVGKELDERTVISNCWVVYLGGAVCSVCCYPLYLWLYKTNFMAVLFVAMLLLNSFISMFSQYLRCVGKSVAYIVQGILATAVSLTLNVVFLLVFKLGMKGYLYSSLISQMVTVCYLLVVGELWRNLNFKSVDVSAMRKMLAYCVPLIPNSLMWWIMSAGDKYIINYFLGDGANGLYSLSLKIPTVVSLLYSIFYQAWQMSAIEENKSDNKTHFYETVFKYSNAFLSGLIVCIIIAVKPVYFIMMSESFWQAWIYVPFLCVATAFNCQASFFGVIYAATENTKKIFFTTALGAASNLLFNFILIQPLGLHGVALGTLMGYVVVCIVRARDTKKESNMNFDLKRTAMTIAIVTIQSIVSITQGNIGLVLSGIISLLSVFLLYKKEAVVLKKHFLSFMHRRTA